MCFHCFLSTPGSPLHKIEETSTASLPHSRGGPDTWENLVWSSKDVNARKRNRLPYEAGLKLLSIPRTPKELPVTALIRNAHGVAEWKLFLNDLNNGRAGVKARSSTYDKLNFENNAYLR